jgi:hypothetical protein
MATIVTVTLKIKKKTVNKKVKINLNLYLSNIFISVKLMLFIQEEVRTYPSFLAHRTVPRLPDPSLPHRTVP